MSVDVKVTGANQLRDLSKALKTAGRGDLRKRLGKAIRTAGRPAVQATKQAVRTLPVTGSHGGGRARRREFHAGRSKIADEEKRRAAAERRSGLRRTIAAAISLKVRPSGKKTGVRIVVNADRLPEDQRALPWALDRPGGWYHPTFGHDPDVHQQGRPWFSATLRRHAPRVRMEIGKAMADINKKITRRFKFR